MGKGVSIAGWLVFIAAVLGAIFRTGTDDPMTASLKASGSYQKAMTVLGILIVAAVVWLIREMWVTVKLQKKLNDLKRRKDR
jgi:phosphotransferase system  glucose/maltose/N-acetylglucosamine-specific IIC component